MFADPSVALMIMIFLCFLGMLVMFLFVIRAVSVLANTVKEGARQQSLSLADMERQLMDLTFLVRNSGASKDAAPLVSESDAPAIMTDGELSSLLTSLNGGYVPVHERVPNNGKHPAKVTPETGLDAPGFEIYPEQNLSPLPDLRLTKGSAPDGDSFPNLDLERKK